jgi:hypothetical protein
MPLETHVAKQYTRATGFVKTMKAIVFALATTMASGSLLAQRPGLAVSQSLELQLLGHTNNYYQLKCSTNLSGWSPYGDPFLPGQNGDKVAFAGRLSGSSWL